MSNYNERVLARRLLESMGLQMTTNVPLMKICRSLGYKVFLVGPESLDPGDLDGNSMVVNGVSVIQINKDFPACRRRFSLAHEMGHLLCDHHFQPSKTERAEQRVGPHVETAETDADPGAELRPQRLDVADLLQVLADVAGAPLVLECDELVVRPARFQGLERLFSRQHARQHGVVRAP